MPVGRLGPLGGMLCLAVATLATGCAWFADPPPPSISKSEALAIINNHADNVRALWAPNCEIVWEEREGIIAEGSGMYGSLLVKRGGKIRMYANELSEHMPEPGQPPTTRMVCDGKRFWVEINDAPDSPVLPVYTGTDGTRQERTGDPIPMQPGDLARAICLEPVQTANFKTIVTASDETQVAEKPTNMHEDVQSTGVLKFAKVRLYYTVVNVETTQGKPIRRIWIDRETRRIRRQVYYDTRGAPLFAVRYAYIWKPFDLVLLPARYDIMVGDGTASKRMAFKIFIMNTQTAVRNAQAGENDFHYTPPEGRAVLEVGK